MTFLDEKVKIDRAGEIIKFHGSLVNQVSSITQTLGVLSAQRTAAEVAGQPQEDLDIIDAKILDARQKIASAINATLK